MGQPLANLDGRGLARAIRTEQPEAFAGADGEIDAIDGDDILEALAQVRHAQGRCRPLDGHPRSVSAAPQMRMKTRCRYIQARISQKSASVHAPSRTGANTAPAISNGARPRWMSQARVT